ncbi:metallophosphoesterase family protein [Rufibacter aurantiacus]|uniref:metallophosphoesterase family protein n=1 Tax=Rufibacter aurantiacus TaxID=2817374 RepID=UPI001FEF13A7|nr:metallophosphoesterase [Rufibacter aurantiacus]
MMKPLPLLFSIFLLFLVSCSDLFEYHPNQIRLKPEEKNLTAFYLRQLAGQSPGDTLRILVMGDTQRFYDETVDFVHKANSFPDIDFVIHLGDISDFGMSREFRWVHDIMKDLRWPYLTVIGNHDLLGNARKVYAEMYGDLNYAFTYGHTKFVFLDTNGREYGFNGNIPNLEWLENELRPAAGENWNQAIVVSHIPPFDSDFDPELEMDFHRALASSGRVPLSLHGHQHGWSSEKAYDDDVLYHVTTTVKRRGFTYLKVWDQGYSVEKIAY